MKLLFEKKDMERTMVMNTILLVFALVSRSSCQFTSDQTRGNCETTESISELKQEIQSLRQTVESQSTGNAVCL